MQRRKSSGKKSGRAGLGMAEEEGSTALAWAKVLPRGPGRVRKKTIEIPTEAQAVASGQARKERNRGDGEERKGEGERRRKSEHTGKFPSGHAACLFRSSFPTLEEPSQKSSDDRM